MQLERKTIVVCGASGGIGQALCQELDRRQARLILIARKLPGLQRVADTLAQTPALLAADLGKSHERETTRHAIAAIGRVDVLINAAGVAGFADFSHQDEAGIESQMHANLMMPVLWTHSVLPLMNPEQARIVNIGSTLGAIGFPGYSAYCASKFGLRGFSEALGRELADTNTRVQYIAPRATHTPINSAAVERMNAALGNRVDTPESVARQVANALTRDVPITHIGWPERLLVPLNALLPGLVGNVIRKQLPTIRKFTMETST